MELHQVRYFLALASTLNFTRAAEMCNVTQPALTKGVQKLERELGGQLIYRERQLTHLTDLGKAVLPMLERALASTEAVRRRARQFQQKEVAPLTIGLAPSISASLVLEPIAEIRKFVPGLHVELREEPPGRLVELLLEGEVNVALVGDLDDVPERIDGWPLFEERYVAILAPSHELADLPVMEWKHFAKPTFWIAPTVTWLQNFTVSAFPTRRHVTIIEAAGTCICSTWRPRGSE